MKGMRCAEIVGAGLPLRVVDKPIPDVPEDGLLLKTLCAGVCHSDIYFIKDDGEEGSRARDVLGDSFAGIIPGHEICGVVQSIGHKVPRGACNLKVGDTVVVYPWRGCTQCETCLAGLSQLCDNNRNTTTDAGQGPDSPGGYATHVPVPDWEQAVKLPSSIRPDIGCMLPCSALTAYGAILKAAPSLSSAVLQRGMANLLIVGAGGLGLWATILAKSTLLPCDLQNVRVIVADISPDKLKTASEEARADDVILWDPGLIDVKHLVDVTTLDGFSRLDAIIDFVGSPLTQQVALRSLYKGGTLVSIGMHGGELTAPITLLVSRSLSIQGMRTGSLVQLRNLVESLAQSGLTTFPHIEYYKLDDVPRVLEDLEQGKIKGRAILKFDD